MSFTCPTRAGWQRLLTPDKIDITLQGLVIQTTLFRKERPKEGPDFGNGTHVGTEGHRTAVEHNLFLSNMVNFCQAVLHPVTWGIKWSKSGGKGSYWKSDEINTHVAEMWSCWCQGNGSQHSHGSSKPPSKWPAQLAWQHCQGFGNSLCLVGSAYLRRESRDELLFAFLFSLAWITGFFYNWACTKYSVKMHAVELPLRLRAHASPTPSHTL